MPVLLDGRALAADREPLLRARAEDVRRTRGRAPLLLLTAFRGADGQAPHVAGKMRACERAGVDVVPVLIPAGADTGTAARAMREAVERSEPDAVFLQVPAPHDIDEAELIREIPPVADVDTMTPQRADAYLRGAHDLPPVTISAALLLLDAHHVSLAQGNAVVVGADDPFVHMLCAALERAGAAHVHRADPAHDGWSEHVRAADVVVSAAARPRLLNATLLKRGAVALDLGYYNDGGIGDIDISAGAGHLGALMPVPGGVGPMTVSALVERTIAFAEASL